MIEKLKATSKNKLASSIFAIVSGAVYAYFLYQWGQGQDLGSLAAYLLFFGPIAIGFLTVIVAEGGSRTGKRTLPSALALPAISGTLVMLCSAVFRIEYWFCVILIAPVFLIFSVVGGALGLLALSLADKIKGSLTGALILIVAFPYMYGSLEVSARPLEITRRVHSSVLINAPPEAVWQNITNIDPILPGQQRTTFFRLIGLPRPIQAVMSCEQVGCVRRGEWEDGLAFDGLISKITLGQSYWVTLTADTSNVHSRTAPLHGIGSPAFDMVDDGYEIERVSENQVVLHLFSTYKTASHINFYSTICLDFLMKDIQRYILSVEKERAESLVPAN